MMSFLGGVLPPLEKTVSWGGHTFLPSSGHLQDRFEILFTVQAQ